MKRAAIFAVVLGLLVAGNARAAAPEPMNQHISPRLVRSLGWVARYYWNVRGIVLPGVEVGWVDAAGVPPGAAAMAEDPGTRVWLSRGLLGPGERETLLTNLCIVFIHERGHNGGLGHDSGWLIMHTAPPLLPGPPPICERWVREHS